MNDILETALTFGAWLLVIGIAGVLTGVVILGIGAIKMKRKAKKFVDGMGQALSEMDTAVNVDLDENQAPESLNIKGFNLDGFRSPDFSDFDGSWDKKNDAR